MSTPIQDAIKRICGESGTETYNAAIKVLRIVLAKTAPGSGHELGAHSVGIPAICAYLASKILRNGEITMNQAQSSSCLNMKVFSKALNIVQSAIGEVDLSGGRQASTTLTYRALLLNMPGADVLARWMGDVEDVLAESGRYDTGSSSVKCAIFAWTCTAAQVENRPSDESLVEQYGLPHRTFSSLVKTLERLCTRLKTQIHEELDLLREARRPASPRKSPSKSALITASQSKSLAQKRRVVFSHLEGYNNDGMSGDGTPSKRRKTTATPRTTPQKASTSRTTLDDDLPDINTPFSTPQRSQRHAQSLNHSPLPPLRFDTGSIDVEDSAMSGPDETDDAPPIRRFRPIFLDHLQWCRRDPRLERMWKQGEHKLGMTDVS